MTDSDSSEPAPRPSAKAPADEAGNEFSQLADEQQPGLFREFLDFALENKKWWLIPIVLVLALVAVFIFVSGAAGPFLYPLF